MGVNPYLATVVIFFTALLQTQFLPGLFPGIAQFIPDLLLLVIISWALLLNSRWSLPLTFLAGLLVDFMSNTVLPIGYNAFTYTLVAFAVSFVGGQGNSDSQLSRSVLVGFGATLLFKTSRLLLEAALNYNSLQINTITQVILPVIFLDSALMILVYSFIRFISKFAPPGA